MVYRVGGGFPRIEFDFHDLNYMHIYAHKKESPMLKNRLAFFDEGDHAFLLIFKRKAGVENAAFEEQAFAETALGGPIDRLLDHHHHRQRE